MHPILSQMRRLFLYLLAWIPFAALLFYLFGAVGGMTRAEAGILVPVLCVIYAFDCLTAWYTCKATPLETSSILRIGSTHLLAASIMSSIWVLVAQAVARLMA